jgi:kynureninase
MKRETDPEAPYPETFRAGESFASELDATDPLARFRRRFTLPAVRDDRPPIYFCGNSLGLQPATARRHVERELEAWGRLAVDAHFKGTTPWYTVQESIKEKAARLVGALPIEVVMMNGLTVNLHLMMATFYNPTPDRYKILIDDFAFPSDTYAVKSQIRHHGHDPEDALLVASPREGDYLVRTEDVESILESRGHEIALVMMSGVNYFTGQVFDMQRITAAARRQGCRVGFDLAHAAGNVELSLHDWDVDFAAWCSYKYLNAGPGAVAGCFVHERHGRNTKLERLAGWWGNDPATRFRMHLEPEFVPVEGADGWQLSNPPILALAPLIASLDIFDEAGMGALRRKSIALTGYMEHLIDRIPPGELQIITPRESSSRGCQLSLRVPVRPRELFDALVEEKVTGDFREPDVIRVAPVPLYNSFHEVWRFAAILESLVRGQSR